MKQLFAACAAVVALGAMAGGANATPIAAGGSVAAAPVTTTPTQVLANFNNVAFTSSAPAGSSSTFSGTYSAAVYKDSANTLCGSTGNCLTFAVSVNNSSSSSDGIETVNTGPFSNQFTYNVGYTTSATGLAPIAISDSNFGAMSFQFTVPGNTSGIISPGRSSDVLIIQTSATNYTTGNLSFQDNQTATVTGFIPAVSAAPEPGAWALMLGGVGMLGMMLRGRQARRREDETSALTTA